jgi:hypothetical protein
MSSKQVRRRSGIRLSIIRVHCDGEAKMYYLDEKCKVKLGQHQSTRRHRKATALNILEPSTIPMPQLSSQSVPTFDSDSVTNSKFQNPPLSSTSDGWDDSDSFDLCL